MEKAKNLQIYFIIGIFVTLMFAAYYNPKGSEANERDLSLGKMGGDVRQLQIALNQKGYNLKPFDGMYGLRTQEAVISLQRKHKLKPNGVFNAETRRALSAPAVKEDRQDRAVQTVSRGVSRKDVVMLARVIHGEARGEPFEGQVAVAAVILNRTRSGVFPKTIEGVIFQPGAFDAVNDGQIWLDPDQKSLKAAELALSGYDPTNQAIYYWNPAKTTNKWIWSRPIHKKIGEHVFAN